MNCVSDNPVPFNAPSSWATRNRACLDTATERARLLLLRRALWLRRRSDQPGDGDRADAAFDPLLLCDSWEAAQRFYREDATARRLTTAIAEASERFAEQQSDLAAAHAPAAVTLVARQFGLSDFERDTLLLCLAAEMDPAFERLFATAQGDAERAFPTPDLALRLFGDPADQSVAAAFTPLSPLFRHRLIQSGPAPSPLSLRPLTIEPRVAAFLFGNNYIDPEAAAWLTPVLPAPMPSEHSRLLHALHQKIETSIRAGAWPIVNLYGPKRAGKGILAQALSGCLGVPLYRMDAARLTNPASVSPELLRLLEREAILHPMGFCLDIPESGSGTAADWSVVIERLGAFLIVDSRERWPVDRLSFAAEVLPPSASGQTEIWRQALGGARGGLDGHIPALIHQFDLDAPQIQRAVIAAMSQRELDTEGNDEEPAFEDLWDACRRQAAVSLGELAQPIQPHYRWDDMVLPPDVFMQLREIEAQVAHRACVYERWGFGDRIGRSRGISALFAGPSGVGKTMAAEALASALRLDLLRIDLSGVVDKYIGETEKNIRRVFDAAEQSGAILFFDEADALFGKRTEIKDSHDRYANLEVSYLLQRMEDYRGLAILATNMKSHLDQAFLRRLRFLIDFPFPDAALRGELWRRAFPPPAPAEGLDFTALSRLEIPGGNIKNIALSAAFLAAAEGTPIRMDHCLRAARREYAKIDKLPTDLEFGSSRRGART